jgi:sphingomyelin phosphodiesterase acid-like 3
LESFCYEFRGFVKRCALRRLGRSAPNTKVAETDADDSTGEFLISNVSECMPPGHPTVRQEDKFMSRWSQYLFFVTLASVCSMFGCGGASVVPNPAPAPVSSYQIVTVSDLHFNPLYDPSLFSQLVAADPSDWGNIYKTSMVTTPSTGGTDTNYRLLMLTLASMQQNIPQNTKNGPVVLFTGDLLGHNIPTTYCKLYASLNPGTAATCATSQASAIQTFIDNTFTFVATQIQLYVGTVPVIYAPGNIDTHSGGAGPGTDFLTDTNIQSAILGLLADDKTGSTFTTTFPIGGYYSVQPPGLNLVIIALNSNSFVDGSPTYSNPSPELAWLDSQLSSAKSAGQKVWILMHVPPGANSQYIAQAAATPSDVDASDASMMWDQSLQSAFLSTLQKYPSVVTLMLAGHTHMDEFRILPTGDVLEQLPGISPCFGNNPAYKVLTIMQNTLTPTDYQSFDYNLAAMPAQFGTLYQFSSTYGAQATLGNSLGQLYPQFGSDQNKRDVYTLLYTSGSESVNPLTLSPWNPINDVNWPIFACTISEMDQSGYVQCVNSY